MTKVKRTIPEVTRLKDQYTLAKATAQAEAEMRVAERLSVVRAELHAAVVNAKRQGYTVSEICRAFRTTDRKTIYDIIKNYEALGLDIVVDTLPHSGMFALTGSRPTEVQVTFEDRSELAYVAHSNYEGWGMLFHRDVKDADQLRGKFEQRGKYHAALTEWAEAAFKVRPTQDQASADWKGRDVANEAQPSEFATADDLFMFTDDDEEEA